MASTCRELPQAILEKGKEVRIFMPRWGNINERRNQLHEVIRLSGINLIIDDTDHPLLIKVASVPSTRLQVYFIDNDDYFDGLLQTTDANGVEYENNDDRCVFFNRGVLETIKKLRWAPNIVHCHGWMSALAPLYIKKAFNEEPSFRDSKVVYSLYDSDFKNPFHDTFAQRLLLPGITKKDLAVLKDGIDYVALTKLAIDHADGIVQQSKKVDPDILAYAKKSGKPFLKYAADDMPEKVNNFYDELLTQNN